MPVRSRPYLVVSVELGAPSNLAELESNPRLLLPVTSITPGVRSAAIANVGTIARTTRIRFIICVLLPARPEMGGSRTIGQPIHAVKEPCGVVASHPPTPRGTHDL